MNDQDLLNLAAEAAGFQLAQDGSRMDMLTNEPWNPLADDGDALRLGVKCQVFEPGENYAMFRLLYADEIDADKRPSEATRRAIVRAAIEIRKAPPSNIEVQGRPRDED